MTHGGKRKNAGRPRINISVSRVLKLFSEGVTKKDIAEKFGVSEVTIGRIIKKEKR
jgi:DNA-binding transcriptional regulator LsrR (DeoR family)